MSKNWFIKVKRYSKFLARQLEKSVMCRVSESVTIDDIKLEKDEKIHVIIGMKFLTTVEIKEVPAIVIGANSSTKVDHIFTSDNFILINAQLLNLEGEPEVVVVEITKQINIICPKGTTLFINNEAVATKEDTHLTLK